MWHTWGLLLGGSWRLDKLKCSHGLKKKSKPRRPLWEEFNDSQSLFWCLPKILFHLHQFLRLPITGEGTHLVKKRCFHVPHYRWAFGKPHHILVLESCGLGICSWGFYNTDAFPACSMIVRCSLCINVLYLIGHYWRWNRFLQLAYLPDKRRDLIHEDDDEGDQGGPDFEGNGDGRDSLGTEDGLKDEKKAIKKRGMLAWFKLRVWLLNFVLKSVVPFSLK